MVDMETPHIDATLALIQQLGRTQGLYPTFPEPQAEDEVARGLGRLGRCHQDISKDHTPCERELCCLPP